MAEQLVLPKMRRRRSSEEGDDRKRRGVEQVLKNERALWRRRALECVVVAAEGWVYFSANEIHYIAHDRGLEPPHHPNVWGAVIRSALLLGVMTKTGNHVKGERPEQHGRMIPEYRSSYN